MPTAFKLYGLAALSNFYDNNEYSCNFHFDKMRRFLSHLLDTDDESKYAFWDDDLFLFYLVSGMLEKGAEHYEQAVREMERAKKHLLRTPGFFFFGYPVLARKWRTAMTGSGWKRSVRTYWRRR